jgi:hypothetical protein
MAYCVFAKHPETPVVIIDIQSRSVATAGLKVMQVLDMMFCIAWIRKETFRSRIC